MNLDEIDLGMLELLLEDGRMSFNEISKQLGISTPTVSVRLKNLEHLGIIEGFHIRLNNDKLDQFTVIATIGPRSGMEEELLDLLAKNDMIREVYSMDSMDILIKATLPGGADIRILLEFLNNRDLVEKYHWSVIVNTYKELPRGFITSGSAVDQPCMYCKTPIQGDPVKSKVENKIRYFCCPICESEYLKKYGRLKERAGES